jgi:hypothetical protein
MSDKIIPCSPADVLAAYTEHKPKSVPNLTFELNEGSPLEGRIISFDREPREYRENKYFVFVVEKPDGSTGELSVTRLTDSQVIKDDVQQVGREESPNKGKWMLKSHNVTSKAILPKHKNQAELISAMVGKKYKAERMSGHVIVEYNEKMFTEKKDKLTSADKKALWDNTAASEKLFKFTEITE